MNFNFSLFSSWYKQSICLRSDTDSEEPNEKDKKQKTEVLAPIPLSVALVKFLGNGESSLSRADVVKRLWEYIKQNDLQVCHLLSTLLFILLICFFYTIFII